jgi:glycosyltransferase involved in cell wall biosynthesis
VDGYGTEDVLMSIMDIEKPDALLHFTDPRFWGWLYGMEHEVRQFVPIMYYNIWDSLPDPMWNAPFYASCDLLLSISKQTYGINKRVLQKYGMEKPDWSYKYIPHGVSQLFKPLQSDNEKLINFRKKYNLDKYDFVVLWNNRNIRRKVPGDLILAFSEFAKRNEDKKVLLFMHTQPIDDNGTDLIAVQQMLFSNNPKYNIVFSNGRYPANIMNLLYNTADTVALISSNEGWGLSLTEGMMCGKPIIATVTGGMQDQMRFEDENGEWIKFTEKFGSNHRGKYKKHGKWAYPVFPSNISLIGSVPTPYIYDDRPDPHGIAKQIEAVYDTKINSPETYQEQCKAAREWVTSDESMQSARLMAKNIIDGIDETFKKWTPRHAFELIQVEPLEQPKHFVKFPIAQ